MYLAPIVLFVYNRPWHTQQTIEALQKNDFASESELFIFSDAAKDERSFKKVKEVRNYIKSIDGFKKITIIERETNWGLANSIIDGVTKIINEYGKIIVLEDDLVTGPYFLKFMNEALCFYQNEEKVMHITGYSYPVNTEELDDTFFIKPASCWSWATWDRAWKYYKKDTNFCIEKFTKKMIYDFNLNDAYKYFDQIVKNKQGKINTWAIFWYASIYLRNGLSLHPKKSYVQNIGHDGEGIHCGKSSVFNVELIQEPKLNFTTVITEDINARKAHEKYFNSIKISFYKQIMNKLKRILNLS
ncbi:glycosyltransferase [Sulfuricurvum sp.]|uniref:glycosyltransferase n=1 Tax=Sulfuricurvum sp. TaxID=2025608 RepID=UPI0026383C05|nr:glycosyltransferase [Sulfuricurvum sp.]MDD3595841.1 glycosyltransferase [Sulfuricurvum sp.]